MGHIKLITPVKFFIGFISASETTAANVEIPLQNKFGEIDYRSPFIPFNFTDYYEEEIGNNLVRRFISFHRLISPEDLPDIKIFTNELELQIHSPNRIINIDPGYLTKAKVVLATTKDYSHRIYLGKGIYGEVTLRYRKGSFEPFDYTYRDYQTSPYLTIFNQIRNLYMDQIK